MENIKVITKKINFLPEKSIFQPEKSIFQPEIPKVTTKNVKKFQPVI